MSTSKLKDSEAQTVTSTVLHLKCHPHGQRININYLFINFEYYTFLSDKADYMNFRKMLLKNLPVSQHGIHLQ